jgi:hypothetical protein
MKGGYTRRINLKGRQIWIPARPLRLLFAAKVCPIRTEWDVARETHLTYLVAPRCVPLARVDVMMMVYLESVKDNKKTLP